MTVKPGRAEEVEEKERRELDELFDRRIGDLKFLIAWEKQVAKAKRVLNPQPKNTKVGRKR